MLNGSWIVTDRQSGKAVCEFFDAKICEFINRDKYNVETALEYLGRVNEEIRNRARYLQTRGIV